MNDVVVLGVRHHGPGSARSVLAELERVAPSAVLIEGPADADPLLPLAADFGMRPPVALLAYANDAPRVSAFWPFAVFSPEWQAMQWALDHGVPVRFIDLPSTVFLAGAGRETGRPRDGGGDARDDESDDDEAPASGPASRPGVRTDPIAVLAAAAGYDDPERWWDDVVEYRLDGQPPFVALTEAMAELRAAAPPPPPTERRREERREAHMRQVLRAARKSADGPVAVVCGAWHSPALTDPLPPVSADTATLRGLPKRRTTLTWVPWTHSRLATASGYGAGVDSPGWYHHLFTVTERTVPRWLTKVAGVLRAHDLPVSSAHVIEAVRLAEALAALRGRPLPGLDEVDEATRAVLCEGEATAAAYVTRDLVIGERLGTVPEGAPAVPLEVDLRAQARMLRLTIDPLEKTLALDLRRGIDRGRSVLLHRLDLLDIPWGTVTADLVRGTGTFHETWRLHWQPDLAVAVVDAALWGTTVAGAAAAKAVDTAKNADSLQAVTATVEHTLLSDLPDALPDVLRALEDKSALDSDVEHLMAALPALVRAVRYGDVRGTDTTALEAVVEALVVRVCAGLPAAVTGLGDDTATTLRSLVDAVHDALGIDAGRRGNDGSTRDRWLAALAQLAGRGDVHGLLAGRVVRLLVDTGRLDRAEASRRFAAHLSIGVAPADKALWAEGFLSGGGLLLVHDRDLLAVLDEWVTSLDAEQFMDVLPLLRRTFGSFSAAERSNLGDAIQALGSGGAARTGVEDDLDETRAAAVLDTVAAILGGGR